MIQRAERGLSRFAKDVRRNADPAGNGLAHATAAWAESLVPSLRAFRRVNGEIHETLQPITSSEAVEAATRRLEALRAGQLATNIALGFHTQPEINLSEDEYIASFPDIVLPAADVVVRFPTPLLVEGRLTLQRKLDLANERRHQLNQHKIEFYIDLGTLTRERKIENEPVILWIHDVREYAGKSTLDAQALFAGDEVGLQDEFADLFIHHPEFFENFGIFAAGLRARNGFVPAASMFDGRPGVSAPWPGYSDDRWGAGSRWNFVTRV